MKRKHVIVTGGSRGLGLKMVEGLLADGYRVSTCSRSKTDAIEQLRSSEYGGRLFWQECSIGDEGQADDFVKAAVAAAGDDGLYGLVNNAGVAQAGILASFPNVESERILRINLLGAIEMARAAAQAMLRQNTGGRIVNISSIIGSRGYNGMAAYSASKAGMDGMSRALARELGRRQITVNSLAPGYVETEMSSTLTAAQLSQIANRTPLGRLATEQDILDVLRFLLSDASRMVTGQVILVDGGISC
ncbi:SDR family NAD(P)-dependent oxidoreductase [Devosia faecipullorum]|uniref:SDR family NAD(P)-dependent oxidoreductase n=1 Tax=Devosia faecipullorum TaxID=2755039 RepID=UPI00187B691A|nr:SDR family oxidoreductase [Devosia faecipullorum]MBE7731969.1 SDR family oxidoreductase [Devosia faecipullorum]